jgi:LacI family transcriptional regulator
MITIKELARLAGASTATVSNVIHEKKNKVSPERYNYIRELIEKNNYVEKMGLRHLSKNRSQIICFAINRQNMYKEAPVFADPFYGHILGTIEEALHRKNYYLMVYASEDIKEIFKTVAAWNIDGIIAESFKDEDCGRLVELTGKPLVSIDTLGKPSDRFITIGSKNAKGAYLMTKYLISRGCRNISVFADSGNSLVRERFLGYRKALRETGIQPPGKPHILGSGRAERLRQYGEFIAAPADGKRAAFFLADFYAIEFNSFLGQRGIAVPDEIAVAGFDDIMYAELCSPGLTTVRQHIERKALLAVEYLFRVMDGKKFSKQNIRLPVELVIRGSA